MNKFLTVLFSGCAVLIFIGVVPCILTAFSWYKYYNSADVVKQSSFDGMKANTGVTFDKFFKDTKWDFKELQNGANAVDFTGTTKTNINLCTYLTKISVESLPKNKLSTELSSQINKNEIPVEVTIPEDTKVTFRFLIMDGIVKIAYYESPFLNNQIGAELVFSLLGISLFDGTPIRIDSANGIETFLKIICK